MRAALHFPRRFCLLLLAAVACCHATVALAQSMTHGSVLVETGEFGQRQQRASLAREADAGWSLDAALQQTRSGNFRDDSQFRERSFNGGAEWKSKQGRTGFSVDSTRQASRFPVRQDDAVAGAPPLGDFGRYDTDRASGFVQRYIGQFDLALEVTRTEKTVSATHVRDSASYASHYDSGETQVAPRLRHAGKAGAISYDSEIGIDLIRWQHRTGNEYWRFDRAQTSQALVLREAIGFGGVHQVRIEVGARHENFDRDTATAVMLATPTSAAAAIGAASGADAADWRQQNAWDLEASFKPLPAWRWYAKASQSFRIDDSGFTAQGYRPLLGQVSHDQELGASWTGVARNASVRVFRYQLRNAIVFDQQLGQSGSAANLDPNQRQGIEIDADSRLAGPWSLAGRVRYINARYDDYPYDGADLPLVPRKLASLRLAWQPVGGHSADIGVQWVEVQRYGNDFAGGCLAATPSFALFDGHYARKLGPWELTLSGSNLADKRYYGAAAECRSSVYANDRRQLRISARYLF